MVALHISPYLLWTFMKGYQTLDLTLFQNMMQSILSVKDISRISRH